MNIYSQVTVNFPSFCFVMFTLVALSRNASSTTLGTSLSGTSFNSLIGWLLVTGDGKIVYGIGTLARRVFAEHEQYVSRGAILTAPVIQCLLVGFILENAVGREKDVHQK